jgi:hypothetical protein
MVEKRNRTQLCKACACTYGKALWDCLLVIAIAGRYRQRKVRLSENEIEPSCVRSVQKYQDQQSWKTHELNVLVSIICGQSIGYEWGTPGGRKESWLSKICIRSRFKYKT